MEISNSLPSTPTFHPLSKKEVGVGGVGEAAGGQSPEPIPPLRALGEDPFSDQDPFVGTISCSPHSSDNKE